MILKPFSKENKEDYIQLAYNFYNSPAVLGEPDVQLFERNYQHILSHDDAFGFFLHHEGKNIGYCLCSKMYSTEVGAPALWIEELTIEAGHQGKGYGSATFKMIHDMFSEVKRFRLEVSLENPNAKKLYERLGYDMLVYEQMIYDR